MATRYRRLAATWPQPAARALQPAARARARRRREDDLVTISMLRVAAKPNANANHPTPPPTVNKARLQGCDSTQGGLNNSTTEKLGHRARAWDTRTPRHRFQCRLLLCACFVSFRGSRIPRRPVVQCGVWRRVEPCEWSRASSPGRGRAETHTSRLTKGRSRLTHTRAHALCFIDYRFSFCARALTSLSPSSFFQTTDSDRDIRAERERDGDTYIVNREYAGVYM